MTKREKRVKLYLRDGRRCAYCGTALSFDQCTIDHVIPRSAGGTGSTHNLVVCCEACNKSKGNKMPGEGAPPVRYGFLAGRKVSERGQELSDFAKLCRTMLAQEREKR